MVFGQAGSTDHSRHRGGGRGGDCRQQRRAAPRHGWRQQEFYSWNIWIIREVFAALCAMCSVQGVGPSAEVQVEEETDSDGVPPCICFLPQSGRACVCGVGEVDREVVERQRLFDSRQVESDKPRAGTGDSEASGDEAVAGRRVTRCRVGSGAGKGKKKGTGMASGAYSRARSKPAPWWHPQPIYRMSTPAGVRRNGDLDCTQVKLPSRPYLHGNADVPTLGEELPAQARWAYMRPPPRVEHSVMHSCVLCVLCIILCVLCVLCIILCVLCVLLCIFA